MANAAAASTSWNTLNYTGELFLIGAQAKSNPFLRLIGGVDGGNVKRYADVRFPVAQPWALEAASQPAITETTSLTAPTPTTYVRAQDFNTTQIFQEQVSVSYVKQAQSSRLAAGSLEQIGDQPVKNEFDFQLEANMLQAYKDMNYTFLNGTYQLSTAANVAAKTRGIITACTTNAVAAGSVDISKTLLETLIRTMAGNGAQFIQPVILTSLLDVQRINNIFGYAPEAVNIGGTNVTTIIAPVIEQVGVVWDANIPAGTLLLADLSVCNVVFTPVPQKGDFFYEDLSKGGASESGQLFGMAGIDYGPEEYHGKITGLTTS
jgi:hypothetical protein